MPHPTCNPSCTLLGQTATWQPYHWSFRSPCLHPLGETLCVRRTIFLSGDTTAETSGAHRSYGIFVIGPLALSAGAENYARPLRRLSSPFSLVVFPHWRSRVKKSYHLHHRRLRDFCYWRRRGSRPPNAPQLALTPRGGVVVRMVLRYLCAACMERCLARGGPCVIADVIFAVVIGVRPVGQGSRSQSLGTLGGHCGRGETYGTPGKLAMVTRAQSERPRKRRQSGVVDLDRSLGPELH